jgi:SAM-dependent methyltransferase
VLADAEGVDVAVTSPVLEGLRPASIAHLCAGDGPHGNAVAERLVSEVLRRRTWSVHRHVHLVRAFEEALVDGGIATALSIGCGAGLSELFLAARHPEIEFTLTDFDESRLAIGRARARDLDITNVSFGSLDLLADVGDQRYDWVSSIEVLEHIEDDRRAARNLVALADRWLWVLVPHCTPQELSDPEVIRRAWDKCEHHRPGYTFDTLGQVLGSRVDVRWMRTCYRRPGAMAFRSELGELSDDELILRRLELIATACDDLDGPFDAAGAGIEVLGRIQPMVW